jgi:3-phenylpropionate/trans-cinnamate dioxygenase ferredoxin subunit
VRFHDVASTGQIREGVVRRILVGGVEIAVFRFRGRVFALSNFCTHEGCRLSNGRVTEQGLRCGCHGSLFNAETGEPTRPPAERPLAVFPVKEEDGRVWIAVDETTAQAAAR